MILSTLHTCSNIFVQLPVSAVYVVIASLVFIVLIYTKYIYAPIEGNTTQYFTHSKG